MHTATTNDDLYSRALKNYMAWCKRTGCQFDQPSRATSTITARRVTLWNGRRAMARYELKAGRLVRIWRRGERL